MTTFDKNSLQLAATEKGFLRDPFEKMLRLTEILKYFNEEPFLKEHFALKGGTAINLTIFDLPRLSTDIDMDYLVNDSREEMLIAREKAANLIEKYMMSEGYSLSPASRFTHSLDAFHFVYMNAAGNRDQIKIELNYSLRSHILNSVETRVIADFLDRGTPIKTLAPMEIFASKANALLGRAAPRDLYDFGNMIDAHLFDEEKDMLRKCIIFYMTATEKQIDKNFGTSKVDALNFHKIKRELFPVIRKKEVFPLEERKELCKSFLGDLMHLTDKENEYMDRFTQKDYRIDLLFGDSAIIENLKKHPMALWKCRND